MERLSEFEIILDLINNNPNDADLGKEYRKFCLAYKGKLDEFTLEYPNDFDLGNFLRKKFQNNLVD